MSRGSISWREDREKWQVQTPRFLNPATGKMVRRSQLVKGDRKSAERVLSRLLVEMDEATGAPDDDPTVAQVVEAWWKHHSPTLAASTAQRYRGIIDDYVLDRWGRHRVSELRVVDLDLWLRALADDEALAASSLRQTLTILRQAMKQAVKWELIRHNPIIGVTVPKAKRKVPTPPPATAIASALSLIANGDGDEIDGDPEFAALVRVAASCGLRRGEIAGLRWGALDLDADDPEMVVRESVVQVGRTLYVKTTKTERQRVIGLGVSTVAVLRALRDSLGRIPADDEFVWSLTPDGSRPMLPDTIGQRWVMWRTRAGLPNCRLHDLRHAMASELIAAGEDIVTVANRLGHAKVSTTLDIYAHAMKAKDTAAAARMDSILDDPAPISAMTKSPTP